MEPFGPRINRRIITQNCKKVNRDSNPVNWIKGGLWSGIWLRPRAPKVRTTKGSRDMLPRELNFKICDSKMLFPAFWDHSQWKIVEFLTGSGSKDLLVPITSVHYRHYRAQSYRRLMLGYQKAKNGWETTEKRQTIVLKKIGLTKKTLSFFG